MSTHQFKPVLLEPQKTVQESERAVKTKLPTPKIRKAIELLVMSPSITITDAANQVGLSREHLSKSLKMPHVKAALIARAQSELPLYAVQAPGRIAELARAAKSEKVRLEANQDLLNRTTGEGEGPSQVVNIQINI